MKNSAVPLTMAAVLLAALLSSCTGAGGRLKLLEGNFLFGRGRVNEAVGVYLDLTHDARLAPYANYALGTAYLALEQPTAAIARLRLAEELAVQAGENPKLLYRIRYNIGVLRFERGDFAGAAASFRAALEIDGTAVNAKRNLELSLMALAQTPHPREKTNAQNAAVPTETSAGNAIITDYVRRQEIKRWKNRTLPTPDDPTGPDY